MNTTTLLQKTDHPVLRKFRPFFVISLCFLLSAFLIGGCKTRAERDHEKDLAQAQAERDASIQLQDQKEQQKEVKADAKNNQTQKDSENKDYEKAGKLESELLTKYRYLKSMSGVYEGYYQFGIPGLVEVLPDPCSPSFKLLLNIFPSNVINASLGNRKRTVSEITNDYSVLHLSGTVSIMQIRDGKPELFSRCNFREVRPNIETGSFRIYGEACPQVFNFNLSDVQADTKCLVTKPTDVNELAIKAAQISNLLLSHEFGVGALEAEIYNPTGDAVRVALSKIGQYETKLPKQQ